jgi:hypothetical protein
MARKMSKPSFRIVASLDESSKGAFRKESREIG